MAEINRKITHRHIIVLLLGSLLTVYPLSADAVLPLSGDSTQVTLTQPKKKLTFWQRLMKPLKWIGKNWSDYDPSYSTPSFYNWMLRLNDATSMEWMRMSTDDGTHIDLHSRLSNKIGIVPGWRFLYQGISVDIKAPFKKIKGRSELGLSINSNLCNIELFRRRTGGDFSVDHCSSTYYDWDTQSYRDFDNKEVADMFDLGSLVKNSLTGFNLNFFLNHRKYSNPAAFTNGAIQLRSVGSPIVGLGYSYQNITNNSADVFDTRAIGEFLESLDDDEMQEVYHAFGCTQEQFENGYLDEIYNEDVEKYKAAFGRFYRVPVVQEAFFSSVFCDKQASSPATRMLVNKMPSTVKIKDWHVNLGYAYNIVFSRRLLLGLSFVASPSIKHIHYDNGNSLTSITSSELVQSFKEYVVTPEAKENELIEDFNTVSDYVKGMPLDHFVRDVSRTNFGLNMFGRASLTYNFNRWSAGINASVNNFRYLSSDVKVNNYYCNVDVNVTFHFGRKRQYRWDGKDREMYIKAALRNKDIEAMRDTFPKSNIDKGTSYSTSFKKTHYKTDVFDLNFFGCDLVQGPDGSYGSFTIEDGYVTPGQDTEGRLHTGLVLPLEENGNLHVTCGHDGGIRASNWWKSQLTVRQIPNNWYPELLHYALRGCLTFYVRSNQLGTKDPVKIVIPDFCISHGKETKQFFQIAAKSFQSHSAFSIVGNVSANGRKVRLYIESKQRGLKNYIYLCPLKASTLDWMKDIEDTRPISRISLPGTHDAGTASLRENVITSTSHTQNFTIAEQLEDGVRAFDIRLKRNMKFGHTMECRDGLPETLDSIRSFLTTHPSEFIVAFIGSDENGEWNEQMIQNFKGLLAKYPGLFTDQFQPSTPISQVRGKVLVIKRQAKCPYGKHLAFKDNSVFEDNGFCVEDVYKEHKTYKKIKIVEQHLRDAYESKNINKWYVTFNTIAWGPHHHKPYYSAWGALNISHPMNPTLRNVISLKDYNNFGILFLDFYNDHGDDNQLVRAIIRSNFGAEKDDDYIPW